MSSLCLKIFTRVAGSTSFAYERVLEGERVTVGRSKACTLSLDDPEKRLSRIHAKLARIGQGYVLKVASKNAPVLVNGQAHGPGSEVVVRAGDTLTMDIYELQIVSVAEVDLDPEAAPVAGAWSRPPDADVAPGAPTQRETSFSALGRRIGGRLGLGAGRARQFGIGAAAIAGALVLFLLWSGLQGFLPDGDARKKAEQEVARLDSDIKDLSYSKEAGGRLYFKGRYQGKNFSLIRSRVRGSVGSWAIYTGPLTDRVRATFVDNKGLTEVLAMDRGLRIALTHVGEKHIEYRLYGADRRFLIGSVLYHDKKRWLQGLLRTEAFAGYAALVKVTDVTAKIARKTLSSSRPAFRIAGEARGFSLISAAHAENEAEDLEITLKSYEDKAKIDASDANFRQSVSNQVVVGLTVTAVALAETAARADTEPAEKIEQAIFRPVVVGTALDKVANSMIDEALPGSSAIDEKEPDAQARGEPYQPRPDAVPRDSDSGEGQDSRKHWAVKVFEKAGDVIDAAPEFMRKTLTFSTQTKPDPTEDTAPFASKGSPFGSTSVAGTRTGDGKLECAGSSQVKGVCFPVIDKVIMPRKVFTCERTTFIAKGKHLTNRMDVTLPYCSKTLVAESTISRGTDTQQSITCTPSQAGMYKGTWWQADTGRAVFDFYVDFVESTIDSVAPAITTVGKSTTFVATGRNLRPIKVTVPGCIAAFTTGTESQQQITCTPSAPGKTKVLWAAPSNGKCVTNSSLNVCAPTQIEQDGNCVTPSAPRRARDDVKRQRAVVPGKATVTTGAAAAPKTENCIMTVTGCLGAPPPPDANSATTVYPSAKCVSTYAGLVCDGKLVSPTMVFPGQRSGTPRAP